MNTIEKIHMEFDNATDYLNKITIKNKKSLKKIKNLDSSIVDKANILKSCGFINNSIVKDINNYEQSKKSLNDKKESLDKLIRVYEKYNRVDYKFILYSQLIKILEKYQHIKLEK